MKIGRILWSTIRSYDLRSYLPPMILHKIPILTTLGITTHSFPINVSRSLNGSGTFDVRSHYQVICGITAHSFPSKSIWSVEFLRGCHSFCEKKQEIESEQKVFLIFNKLGTYQKKKKKRLKRRERGNWRWE